MLATAEDRVGGATTPAPGDLDGDALPEIVAKGAEDGTRDCTGGASASLSIADLDDDDHRSRGAPPWEAARGEA